MRILTFGKKGQSFDVAFSVLWLIYLTFVLLAILLLVNFLVSYHLDTRATETQALTYHFLYSYHCSVFDYPVDYYSEDSYPCHDTVGKYSFGA